MDVTKDGKRKRNRSGYEDGVSTLYKECAAEDFIMNDKPGEMLGSHHVHSRWQGERAAAAFSRIRKPMKIQLHSLFEGGQSPC